ncbi:MAG: hypothetical protein R3A49_09985 [Acidimicrobiia bacterium]
MPLPSSRRSRPARATTAALLAALLAVSALLLAACSSDDNETVTVEGDGKGAPGIEGEGSGPIEISDEDGGGSVVLGPEEVPDDFPDDIPLPDDFVVTAAFSGSDTEGAPTANISGVTGQSLERLHALYTTSLPEAGYTIVSEDDDPIEGASAFAITFEGNGITEGKITYAEHDFSGQNPDKFSLSVAY